MTQSKKIASKTTAPKPATKARAAAVEAPAPVAEAPAPVIAEIVQAEPEAIAPVVTTVEPVAPIAEPVEKSTYKTPILKLKDITMTTDFTATVTEAATEVQAKFQDAFNKSSAAVTEMTDLAKGNVEAVVEAGKLLAAGAQDMGKSFADEAKSAYETATADMKDMAAIKSPTELFQLQGKILRRNFDMFIAATSKNTDAALKLANEAMAPISGRVNLAAEKLAKVA